jgi:hypothetical protein
VAYANLRVVSGVGLKGFELAVQVNDDFVAGMVTQAVGVIPVLDAQPEGLLVRKMGADIQAQFTPALGNGADVTGE